LRRKGITKQMWISAGPEGNPLWQAKRDSSAAGRVSVARLERFLG